MEHSPPRSDSGQRVRNPCFRLLPVVLGLVCGQQLTGQTAPVGLPELKLSNYGVVHTMALQADGKILVGGDFSSVNDIPRSNLARLNPDGTLDLSWAPQLNGICYKLITDNQRVFLVGDFSQIGGEAYEDFAGVTVATGAVDTTLVRHLFSTPLSVVNKAVEQVGDSIFVGGSNGRIVKIGKLDGQIDPTWVPVAGAEAVEVLLGVGNSLYAGYGSAGMKRLSTTGTGVADPGFSPPAGVEVNDLAHESGALVLVPGYYDGDPGYATYSPVKIDALSGNRDAGWNPVVARSQQADFVYGLTLRSVAIRDGWVYLGGSFSIIGGTLEDPWRGTYSSRSAGRVSLAGAGVLDTGWSSGIDVGGGLQNEPYRVYDLLVSDKGVLVGGGIGTIRGKCRMGMSLLNNRTGDFDRTFAVQVQHSDRTSIMALERQKDGKLLIGGDFLFINGVERQYLARLNADGSLDQSWESNCARAVTHLAIGGDYLFAGLVASYALPRIEIATGKQSTAAFLGADGPYGVFLSSLVANDQFVYFTHDGVFPESTTKLALSGAPYSGWTPATGPFGSTGDRIFKTEGDTLYTYFVESYPGYSQSIRRLDRNGDGGVVWETPIVGGYATGMAVDSQYLYVCGSFDSVSNQPIFDGLCRINKTTGAVDLSWHPSILGGHPVNYTQILPNNVEIGNGGVWVTRNGKLQFVDGITGAVGAEKISSVDFQAAEIAPQTSNFVATWTMVPGADLMDGVTGLCNGVPLIFGDLAVSLRFSTGGLIQAIDGHTADGKTYRAETAMSYSRALRYHVRVDVNMTGKTYSATVTPDGGTSVVIASNYGFRTSQLGVTQLNRLACIAPVGNYHVVRDVEPAKSNEPDVRQPTIDGSVNAVRLTWEGLYLGGSLTTVNGSPVSKIALLATAEAPVVGIDAASGKILVTKGVGNGGEVPFFRVSGISGGTLKRSDGTIVSNGDYLSFSEGALGLVWTAGSGGIPSFEVRSGLAADSSALGALATVVNPSNGSLQPLILFEKAEVSGVEDQGSIEVKVRYTGNSPASVRIGLATGSAVPVRFSPGPVGDYFDPGSQTLSFTGAGTKSLLLPLWNDSEIEPDEVLYADLSNATGALIGGPGRSRILLIENDVFGTSTPGMMKLPVPVLPALATGSLAINLIGDDDKGQWRLSGEVEWRGSSNDPGGTAATGLTGGNYKVEFRPVDGLLEPAVITVPVGASEAVTKTGIYANGSLFQPGTGLLEVVVEPEGVADEDELPKRGQWKRQGDTVWRNSGELLEVSAGLQVVQFKEVDERETPPDRTVSVRQGQRNAASGTYLIRSQIPNARQTGVLPLSAPAGAAAAVGKAPYCFNGQIATELGFGSGVVTQEHTVLTAAHVLFDDIALAQAKRVEWFFQRHKGQNESPGLTPRGWYRFEGYASQRALDVVNPSFGPGIGTVDSQNLDVAVMYFLEPAGRGGYGGYQVSETTANQWLLGSRDKFLAGYPIVDVSEANRGRLHATDVSNDRYNLVRDFVLSTRDIESRPGNSGGPVYAWDENALSGQGAFFPVAVYLGGTGDTTVRAINNGVVSLMNLAEIAGSAGGNGTGGGATYTSLGFTEDGLPRGFVTVKITGRPASRWRLLDATGKVLSNFTKSETPLAITPGDVFFELEPLAGLPAAGRELVTVFNGQLTTKTAAYPVSYDSWAQTELIARGATGPTGPLADYDRDGIVHLLEYAFALNPMVADRKTLVPGSGTSGLPSVRLMGEGIAARIRVEYVRRQAPVAPGGSYRVEMAASPIGPWGVSALPETVTWIDETWERVVVDAGETAGTQPKYFARVRVTAN